MLSLSSTLGTVTNLDFAFFKISESTCSIIVISQTFRLILQRTLCGISRLEWFVVGFRCASMMMGRRIDWRHDFKVSSLEPERYGHGIGRDSSVLSDCGQKLPWLRKFWQPALTRDIPDLKMGGSRSSGQGNLSYLSPTRPAELLTDCHS